MTGPEHYQEAERLLTEAAGLQVDYEDASTLPLHVRAQVHATLALTAATAMNTLAYQIRNGYRPAFQPAGSFQSKAYVKSGDLRVYARYVGEVTA